MTVAKEIMTTDVITLTPDTDIARAARILLDNGINGAPVVDDQGRLKGILCQSDLVVQQKKLPLPGIFTLLDAILRYPQPNTSKNRSVRSQPSKYQRP